MQEAIGAITTLSGLIEKGGVIAVLMIACGVLIKERIRLTTELRNVYRQRDRWRLAFVKCKSALDGANIKVDLSDLSDLTGGES